MNHLLQRYSKYLLVVALLYFPIFGHLDILPIRIWDEARLANNAYEMANNNDFVVTHFGGKPDMWNTKPPLMIWIQASLMKMMGVNEVSVRLPSAIAAFITCIALLAFALWYLKDFWFGFISVLVLVTTTGYISIHGSRTGDYDTLLTLFTTLSGFSFFAYCESAKRNHLYWFFAFTILAVLTKGVNGLLFLPGFILYSVVQKQFVPLLKNKHFYMGIFSFIVLVGGYYLLRELNNPGYLKAVYNNELGGRYLQPLEGNRHEFWFYYDNIINSRYVAWYLLVPCGLIVGLAAVDKKIFRLALFSGLMIFTLFLVISAGQTKLEWYDIPLYPFMAVLVALFIHFIFNLLKNWTLINQSLRVNVLPYLFVFIIAVIPYKAIINTTYKPKESAWDQQFYEIGYYLRDAIKGIHPVNGQFLVYDGYSAQNMFYLNILNDKGTPIALKNPDKLETGDVVIVCQDKMKEYVASHYKISQISQFNNIFTYQIVDHIGKN
ncbi:MAG TPA: glycosyltransferase family 39 protein [Bacteroidales bacterium]|nr:glycosyltransferase family 39 protein [Bacteroidales bacterium]